MAVTVFYNLIALLVIIDPVGISAIFVGLTRGLPDAERRRTALRGILIAGIVLLVFAFLGEFLLRVLGITLPAFKIAGGVLLFLLATDMVFARQTGLRSMTAAEDREAESKSDISVFPLAIPLIAGPGAMTSVVLLMSRLRGDPIGQAGFIMVLMVALCLTLVALLFASRMVSLLGVTGTNVVSRTLGIVLAALAVQFLVDGTMESFGLSRP
ncbi:MAG: MarC family protein [Rhodospirillaceae bacterium]|nr:MarC family protein [Rhodospirillaceae bacterium]